MRARDGMLVRVFAVLECFTEEEPELTAAELATRSNVPLSSLHRILKDLLGVGALTRTGEHRYAVGARLWEIGELSLLSLRLRETAIPHLMRLYDATGENVHLGVLDPEDPHEASVLYVGRVTGKQSIPTVSRAGGRGPLHATGVGKALLAGCDDAWLDEYFERPLLRETSRTLVRREELRASIEAARSRGYATTREEMTLGNVSVAVRLPTIIGLPPVAVGVVVHLEHADERRLAALVHQTAKDITHAVRDSH